MAIPSWLQRLLRRRFDDDDFQDEIRAHLAENYPNASIGNITGDPAGEAAAPSRCESDTHLWPNYVDTE